MILGKLAGAFDIMRDTEIVFGSFTGGGYDGRKTFVPEFKARAGLDPVSLRQEERDRGIITSEHKAVIYVPPDTEVNEDMGIQLGGAVYRIERIIRGDLGITIEAEEDTWI